MFKVKKKRKSAISPEAKLKSAKILRTDTITVKMSSKKWLNFKIYVRIYTNKAFPTLMIMRSLTEKTENSNRYIIEKKQPTKNSNQS